MGRLVARGKYLFEGERKFFARGVSYGPFPENSRGERYPEPERVVADFALMTRMGVNVVRCYVPPPPRLLEEAIRHNLRLMVGIPWPFHMAFLDSREMAIDIRNSIRKGVESMRQYGDAILAYSLGNEVRSDIARWHGPRAISKFLRELYDIGKQADPAGLFTYSNYPTTEYLDLSFLDFVCFNVYLHREEDYRRYLTHLMAATGERPLMLSETGMDTIREGEEHQAELLAWQARAAFELGLSGFIVFAFTDEWHTGGVEISDWAFGLVKKDRTPKRAFEVVGEVFRSELPPQLKVAPKASVIVPAYNAAATIGACLESLKKLHYPNYETIVVDDGSTDTTPQIVEASQTRLIRGDHRGLAEARNAGIEAASGEIVAFVDADARADADWLYHLVEAITRRAAVAAGGPNFAPYNGDAAFAFAPGIPREVRGEGDQLTQLCGCNMAITKSALREVGGFDPLFEAAGDDVDLSWRLTELPPEKRAPIVSAPGAVVIHERRATLRDYLRQQRGYGAGENVLSRKYPFRTARNGGLYGGTGSWLSAILGGPRVYHGAFGRGLFQSVYTGADLPWLAELPQNVFWIVASIFLMMCEPWIPAAGALGLFGIMISIATAILSAAFADTDGRLISLVDRAKLAMLYFIGPLVRSFARVGKGLVAPSRVRDVAKAPFRFRGRIIFSTEQDQMAGKIESAALLADVRAALIKCGLRVAVTDGFKAWDLNILPAAPIRVPINAVRISDSSIALLWRMSPDPIGAITAAVGFFVIAMISGWIAIPMIIVFVVVFIAGVGMWRVPSLLGAAAESVAKARSLKIDTRPGETF
jgi:glycosyltransferase involved in cell wall biosynthesis